MPLRHEPARDDRQLERYLLGLLPPSDAERLDQASIEDDDFAWRLRLAEDDLIDAYLRSALAGETLDRFETYYLSSPRRRERVAVSASFLRAVDRAAMRSGRWTGEYRDEATTPQTGTPEVYARAAASSQPLAAAAREAKNFPATGPHNRFAARLTLVPRLAAVAAVVAVTVGVWLVSSGRLYRLDFAGPADGERTARPELAAREGRDLQPEAPIHKPGATAAPRSETLNESTRPSPIRPAAPAAPARTPQVEAVLATALVLSPQTRASATIPVLALPPGSDWVALELRLEPGETPRYQVGLRDPVTNQVVWRSGSVAKSQSNDEPSLVVVVPVRLLKPQHYSIDLIVPGTGDGPPEVVGSYTFRVLPR